MSMALCLMEGNEAVAWGALEAGCRFFAGYPITPATGVFNTMLRLLPPAGGVVIQGEDEIASIGYCMGASMAGLKVMTATSGPGISLYSEQIGFAIGGEMPMVIVDVQRLGPSTGAATRGADGDVQFLRWCTSGGVPVIALAPTDVADCFWMTKLAFDWAEEFRCPVFVASNKEIGMTRESVDLEALSARHAQLGRVARLAPPPGEKYIPFRPAPGRDVPYFLPLGDERLVRQTSSTHGEDGYITTDPAEIQPINERLCRKIEAAADRLAICEVDGQEGAEILLVTYGVTSRAVLPALRELRREGMRVSHLTVKTIWPVPEAVIRAEAAKVKRVLVVEMNMGQYVHEVARIVKDRPVGFYGRMDGALLSPERIKEALRHA